VQEPAKPVQEPVQPMQEPVKPVQEAVQPMQGPGLVPCASCLDARPTGVAGGPCVERMQELLKSTHTHARAKCQRVLVAGHRFSPATCCITALPWPGPWMWPYPWPCTCAWPWAYGQVEDPVRPVQCDCMEQSHETQVRSLRARSGQGQTLPLSAP